MVPKATDVRAAVATLLEGSCWESTRPALFESGSVAVLIVPRRRGRQRRSDVTVTIRPVPGARAALVLTGPAGCWRAALDGAGSCTIRDVPDARYEVRLASD